MRPCVFPESQSDALSGKIILLNGASSSSKSTLATALQDRLEQPFWHFSIDHLDAAGVLPQARITSGEFTWSTLRPHFFEGFHRCIPVLAEAGNNLIVEHIVEAEDWMQRLLRLLGHAITHTFALYDMEVDATLPVDGNVDSVIAAWRARRRPSAFDRMARRAVTP